MRLNLWLDVREVTRLTKPERSDVPGRHHSLNAWHSGDETGNRQIHVVAGDVDRIVDQIGAGDQIGIVFGLPAAAERTIADVGAIVSLADTACWFARVLAGGHAAAILNTGELSPRAGAATGNTAHGGDAGQGPTITPA
jgi:hypothetical protein